MTDTQTTQTPASDAAPAPVVQSPAAAAAAVLYPEAGGESASGDASTSGEASTAGNSAAAGTDTLAGSEGNDSPSGESTTSGDATTAHDYSALKLPEGVVADDALMSEFTGIAKDANLDPAAAQRLLDLQAKALSTAATAAQDAFNTQQSAWETEVNALPEFTGEATRTATLASIAKVFDEFGTPELRANITATGLGNNPDMVKFVLAVAKATQEGAPARTGRPVVSGSNGKSLGARLYGSTDTTPAPRT